MTILIILALFGALIYTPLMICYIGTGRTAGTLQLVLWAFCWTAFISLKFLI